VHPIIERATLEHNAKCLSSSHFARGDRFLSPSLEEGEPV